MKELWVSVSDIPELMVSNYGKIKYATGKQLAIRYNGGFYPYVTVKGKQLLIHRIVAKEFIPNPDNKPYVHHIDENRSNAKSYNLMWVTPRENMSLGTMDKRQDKMVAIYPNGKKREFTTYKECAKVYMINPLEVLNVMRGQRETYMDMKFEWKHLGDNK